MTTPNDDQLIKRLRVGGEMFRLCGDAADRIEALIAERDAAVAKWQEEWEAGTHEGRRRATAAIVADLRAESTKAPNDFTGFAFKCHCEMFATRYERGDRITEAKEG